MTISHMFHVSVATSVTANKSATYDLLITVHSRTAGRRTRSSMAQSKSFAYVGSSAWN